MSVKKQSLHSNFLGHKTLINNNFNGKFNKNTVYG